MSITRPRPRTVLLLTAVAALLGATGAVATGVTSPQIKGPTLPLVRAADMHRGITTETAPRGAAEALAGGGTCTYKGTSIACYDPSLGWWDSENSCYWSAITPPPPAGDPLWLGLPTSSGTLYNETCETPDGLGVGVLGNAVGLSSNPPPGYGGLAGTVNQLLALQAVVSLGILGPDVRTAPPAGGEGLVGLPVWLWSNGGLLTWGPLIVNLPLLLLTVNITALGKKIDWYMGDGGHVTCTTLGTKYTGAADQVTSPDCGYVFTRPNKPGQHYTITAVSTWVVSWTIGPDTGTVSIVRSTTTTLRIDELQVVNQ